MTTEDNSLSQTLKESWDAPQKKVGNFFFFCILTKDKSYWLPISYFIPFYQSFAFKGTALQR